MKSDIEAVLFDMDGVLVDSFEVLYHALKDIWEKFEGCTMGRDKFEEKHWGDKLEDKVERRWGEEAGDYFFSSVEKHFHRAKLLPGVRDVLTSIPQRRGVVTNGPQGYTDNFLSHFDLKKHFDVIICSDDVDEIKPDPEPILKACEGLGVGPENVVFVGDTDNDVGAGRAAGVRVVGIGTPGDREIENVGELPRILSEIGKS